MRSCNTVMPEGMSCDRQYLSEWPIALRTEVISFSPHSIALKCLFHPAMTAVPSLPWQRSPTYRAKSDAVDKRQEIAHLPETPLPTAPRGVGFLEKKPLWIF